MLGPVASVTGIRVKIYVRTPMFGNSVNASDRRN